MRLSSDTNSNRNRDDAVDHVDHYDNDVLFPEAFVTESSMDAADATGHGTQEAAGEEEAENQSNPDDPDGPFQKSSKQLLSVIHNLRLRVPNKYRVEKSVITAARDIFSDRGSRMPLSDNGFLELPPDAIDDLTRTQETHGYTNAAHCFRMNILAYLFAALAENAGDEQEQHQSLLNYRKAIRVYLEIAVFGKTHATYISRGGKALLRIAGSLGPLVLLCPEHLKWLQLGYCTPDEIDKIIANIDFIKCHLPRED
ncbi:hypothetical protein LRAMOSA11485 [Lichtheimia ramosa]|uniref:Uncharacterized protein n=1 Tax=Lichtheimia ramosa TaxID=688394 RepID=A0A077WW25_9FUNG|nr:hypothetical protein LRAMOSA11485 [Lichtheimia ramosa]